MSVVGGYVLGIGPAGCHAIDNLLWPPLEQLRYLVGKNSRSIDIRRAANSAVCNEDILGVIVSGPEAMVETTAIVDDRPELLKPALTVGIALHSAAYRHPLQGRVDMPVTLPDADDDRQLDWLIRDLYSVLFVPSLFCVDLADIVILTEHCQQVCFASVTGTEPLTVTRQALQRLTCQGIAVHRLQGMLMIVTADRQFDRRSLDRIVETVEQHLPEVAAIAYTVRGYSSGICGACRVSVFGAC